MLVILLTALVPLVVAIVFVGSAMRTAVGVFIRPEVGEQLDRGLELVRPLSDDAAGPEIKAKFVTDKKRLDELENAGQIVTSYHQIEKTPQELYAAYTKTFAALLVFTVLVTLVLGFFLARGVTRR